MARKYLSAAIDHGTSNSSIAVMEPTGPRVIKLNNVDDVMPSAVYISKRGVLSVGDPARRAIMTNEMGAGDGHTRYKPSIGQDNRYEFTAAGKSMTAPELGAIVIGRLLQAYRDEMGEDIKACVITVPAKFEHSATEGTREAARKAGLEYSPQLQEPIAAAMAYGFSTDDDRAQWLIFDLGGGTLDISLVIVRHGEMIVPEGGHAGDNRLGGSNFDRMLVDYALGHLSKTHDFNGFTSEARFRSDLGKLTLAAEEAKIRLSNRSEAVIECADIKDARGRTVKVEVPVTRAAYEAMIAPEVEKAVHICRTLLEKNRLSGQDVNRLILIGGPTKTPYIQQVLADRLKIHLDATIDPMTAVAQGAAIYAATLELPEHLQDASGDGAPNGGAQVRLEYERYSKLPMYCVVGTVESDQLGDGGLSVEIRRGDGMWASGRLPVDETGVFSTDVLLIDQGKPHLSQFTTTVYDRVGRPIATVEEPAIWYPYTDAGAMNKLANSLRIGVKGNLTEILVPQGADLRSARKRASFVTTKPIRRGSNEDVLRIPVLEGVTHLLGSEDDHADCNALVGTLRIVGSDQRVTCDLPQGSEIDVTLHQNESREIHAVAYIPLLDAEFEAKLSSEAFGVTADQVAERFEGLKQAMDEVERLQRDKPVPAVAAVLETIRRLDIITSTTRELQRAQDGESASLHRVYKMVLELGGTLNHVRELQKVVRIERHLEELERAATDTERKDLQGIKADFAAAAKSGDAVNLGRVGESLDQMDSRIRQRPYHDVLLDLIALSGMRVTSQQHDVFKRADSLLDRIGAKGGISSLTNADIAELTRMHQELGKAYPDLDRRRIMALADIQSKGRGVDDLDISDVDKARPKTH